MKWLILIIWSVFPALQAQSTNRFLFRLDTNQARPASGSRATGSGLAVISEDGGALQIEIQHTLKDVAGASIRRADAGENGPIIFDLGLGKSPIQTVLTLTDAISADLRDGKLYVNIETETVPSGEIRGQIRHNPPGSLRYVTITNLTRAQTFSPPVIITHTRDFKVFELGKPASPRLRQLAESGQNAALIEHALGQTAVLDVVALDANLEPGQSIAVPVRFDKEHAYVSALGMLTASNDAFFAVNGQRVATQPATSIPSGVPTITQQAYAYDAGSETNNEDCAFVPGGPCIGEQQTDEGEGRVYLHSGIHGVGDLDPDQYDWRGPVAQIDVAESPSDQVIMTFDLDLGVEQPGTFVIKEPSMCDGFAKVTITYSKKANFVRAALDFKGLPYKLSITRPDADPAFSPLSPESTPFTAFPESVEEGAWQFWLAGHWFTTETDFWYDTSGALLGNTHDLAGPPPANALRVRLPALQCVGSPLFEALPDGSGHFEFEYVYNKILDHRGTAGFYGSAVSLRIDQAQAVTTYFTTGGLPEELHMTWDDFLKSMTGTPQGARVAFFTTLVPNPKPDYMLSRTNRMPGWVGFAPATPLSDFFLSLPCESFIYRPPTP